MSSGINNIIEKIIQQAEKEAEKIISEANAYKNKKINEAKQEGEQLLQKTIELLEKQEKSELNKAKSAALLNSKHQLLKTKEKVIEETFNVAKEKISKIISSDRYKEILTKFIEEGAIALNGGKLVIQLPKQHKEIDVDLKSIATKVQKQIGTDTTIEIDPNPIKAMGGVIIRNKDNTKWVDNTIEARLERYDKHIRTKVTSILFD